MSQLKKKKGVGVGGEQVQKERKKNGWIYVSALDSGPPSLLSGTRERLLSSVSGLQILSLTADLSSSVSLFGWAVLQLTEKHRATVCFENAIFICDPAPGETRSQRRGV